MGERTLKDEKVKSPFEISNNRVYKTMGRYRFDGQDSVLLWEGGKRNGISFPCVDRALAVMIAKRTHYILIGGFISSQLQNKELLQSKSEKHSVLTY